MRIAVTGLGSYIGFHIRERAKREGISLHLLGRSRPAALERNEKFFDFDLEKGCAPEALQGVDCLIHLAWYRPHASRRETKKNLNAQAAQKLAGLARACGVSKVLFLSSQLASPQTKSFYGRNKYEVEGIFNRPGDVIIRTGFVFGGTPIGLYRRTLDMLAKSKFLPVICKKAPLNPIHVEDLIDILFGLAKAPRSSTPELFSVGTVQPISFAQFLRTLAGRPLPMISLPAWGLYLPVWLASFFSAKFNDLSERIGGLLSARAMETAGDLRRLGNNLLRTEKFFRERS